MRVGERPAVHAGARRRLRRRARDELRPQAGRRAWSTCARRSTCGSAGCDVQRLRAASSTCSTRASSTASCSRAPAARTTRASRRPTRSTLDDPTRFYAPRRIEIGIALRSEVSEPWRSRPHARHRAACWRCSWSRCLLRGRRWPRRARRCRRPCRTDQRGQHRRRALRAPTTPPTSAPSSGTTAWSATTRPIPATST